MPADLDTLENKTPEANTRSEATRPQEGKNAQKALDLRLLSYPRGKKISGTIQSSESGKEKTETTEGKKAKGQQQERS